MAWPWVATAPSGRFGEAGLTLHREQNWGVELTAFFLAHAQSHQHAPCWSACFALMRPSGPFILYYIAGEDTRKQRCTDCQICMTYQAWMLVEGYI